MNTQNLSNHRGRSERRLEPRHKPRESQEEAKYNGGDSGALRFNKAALQGNHSHMKITLATKATLFLKKKKKKEEETWFLLFAFMHIITQKKRSQWVFWVVMCIITPS